MSDDPGHARDYGHDHERHHDHGHDHDQDHDYEHGHILERIPAGTWNIDPHGSEVLFKARAFGVLPVTGVFEDFAGALSVEGTGSVSGQLIIQTASINTGWAGRDAKLRGASYFQADRYPEMIFTLERLQPATAEHQKLSGSLQIRDTSVPLEFPVYAIGHADHLHLEGEVMVDHDPAGLGWSKPFYVGSRLRLETALTLFRG